MQSTDENVIAIFLADIHLSLKAPVWRSAEPDWLEAQARVLLEIDDLQLEYECPIICAGDIFDRNKKIADGWNASPELINFALTYLPENMIAVPGQHDLPNHQYQDVYRSAYWTLVKVKKIRDIKFENPIGIDNLRIFGFPPGFPIDPCPYKKEGLIHIAVVHDYVWIKGHSYPNAPEEKKFGKRIAGVKNDKWMGYDIIVYGDNHKGFIHQVENTIIFNCGTLMRRKSDEIDYRPQVGLLLESGKIILHYLDISKDKYLDTMDTAEKPDLDMTGFIDGLEKLGATALDFRDAIKMLFDKNIIWIDGKTFKISDEAKEIVIKAMEK